MNNFLGQVCPKYCVHICCLSAINLTGCPLLFAKSDIPTEWVPEPECDKCWDRRPMGLWSLRAILL